MRDVLIVLNPRRIGIVLDALEALDIDRVWVRNLWLREVQERWREVEEAIAGYEWAWITSDDLLVTQEALDAVRDLADEHPVVTGYCNLDLRDPRVNITRTPVGPESVADAYDFYTREEVEAMTDTRVPTFFAGFALTGMPVEMWRRYPFRNEDGDYAADFNLCNRLLRDGHGIVAHRDAFMWHLKDEWNVPNRDPAKRLWCGDLPAAVELEVRV